MISRYQPIKSVKLPSFSGLRIMHMPFFTRDPGSVKGIADKYMPLLQELSPYVPDGVGYLTIDEAHLKRGEYHRRPGLHVDGVDELGDFAGGWGGGGGYGSSGWLTTSSHVGCRAFHMVTQTTHPAENGDCEHMRGLLKFFGNKGSALEPGVVYRMEPSTLHESVPVMEDCARQFLRISFPSKAAWYEGYTRNPNGVEPAGVIKPRRSFMDYRP